MTDSSSRPNPEQLLARVEQEERRKRRGQLKVFLGYASGVGKSFQMLDEGRRRLERGEDVVACALQPQYLPEVQAILQKLEVIPTVKTDGAQAIDVSAVLRRHPQTALIDGLAYDNPPGSLNAHRWQDVEQLLEAGISVVTSVNIQYLEKLRDEVERISGQRAAFSIPQGFLDHADEIVVVDAPALESLSRGAAPADNAALLAESHKLSRLRELALLVAAGVVDHQLESYLRSHGIEESWGVQERIVVCVTPRSNAAEMLDSGRRNADRFHGQLYVVYVQQAGLSENDKSVLQQNLEYGRKLGAEIETLTGLNAVDAILRFARAKGITQIFVGQSSREGAWRRLWSSFIGRLIRASEGIDVVVFPINDLAGTGAQPGPRGKLKIFLGYVAGVGKTFRMLEEGQQLKRQGLDVVVGYFEPHGRKDTIAKSAGLEMIPRRKIAYRDCTFEEMDTPAILARRPAICLVDELPHTNIPGSEHAKRWEDVQALLDAGIDVLTTLNIQHLESLNDQIFQISGVRVRETVPDWFVKQSSEVTMVDATSGALLNRLKRGDIYAPDKAQRAMENFFKESTLAALRELALRHTALELESREKVIKHPFGPSVPDQTDTRPSSADTAGRDRILIYLTPEASTAMLTRRGRRMADYLGADCLAIYVCRYKDISGLRKEEREAIAKHLNFARNLHIETRVLNGDDTARTLIEFARRNQTTHILVARPKFSWWTSLLGLDAIVQIARYAKDMRVIIVAERGRPRS